VWNGLTNPNSRKKVKLRDTREYCPRIDFREKFAPIARMDIIRAVLVIASQNKWKVYQIDLKSTSLNDILEE